MVLAPIHRPVLLKEAVNYLKIRAGEKYIDATLGQGGQALEIIRRGGCVLGVESDPKTREWLFRYLKQKGIGPERLKVVSGNFRDLAKICRREGFVKVRGIIFDLGLSAFLLKESGRGFSFQKNEPLDMRLDPDSQAVTASALIKSLTEEELYEIFTKFGEERTARRLAAALVRGRGLKNIKTTFDLISLVESAYPPRERESHLAKIFQALRLSVNQELTNLKTALPQALRLLNSGGRLVVLAYQSLEDRLVKRYFKVWQAEGLGVVITKKPVRAKVAEVLKNRAARSANLRAFEKVV